MYINLYSYQTSNLADERPEWQKKDNNLKASRNGKIKGSFLKRKR